MQNPHVPIMLLEAVLPHVVGDPHSVTGAWKSGSATVIRRGPLVLYVVPVDSGSGVPILWCWAGKGEPPGIPTSHVSDWLSRSDYAMIPMPVKHPAWDALTVELEKMQKEIAAYAGGADAYAAAAAIVRRTYSLPDLSLVDRRNGSPEES